MRYLIAALIMLFLPTNIWANNGERNPILPIERLSIQTKNQMLDFDVEMATTPEQQRLGLMNRTSLADNRGMLFIFAFPQPAAFWMRNTLIPLDIIFIDAQGIIVRIVKQATPLTETPHESGEDVRAALELRGGLSTEKGIEPGNKIHHRLWMQ